MTRKELKNLITKELAHTVEGREAEAMARVILEDIAALTVTKILCDGDIPVEQSTVDKVLSAVERVKGGEPVQYVIGSAMFHGFRLQVDPGVLIPRPETSGLVDIICDIYKGKTDLHILDACTGSGAIAIALARQLPFSRVIGVDISDDAIAIAKKNCNDLSVKNVTIIKSDILQPETLHNQLSTIAPLDIIVSNPPYVLENEKAYIDPRVLDHEPALALFVPDDEPLLFYKSIVSLALKYLKSRGSLFFEINPSQAKNIEALLNQNGFTDIDILRDFDGKYRYAIATKR